MGLLSDLGSRGNVLSYLAGNKCSNPLEAFFILSTVVIIHLVIPTIVTTLSHYSFGRSYFSLYSVVHPYCVIVTTQLVTTTIL
ncbi:hypothetical protein CEXT_44311 [Caerostris extrusa]|uniref:Uncharacterized protein n=1 Tax=Caerostris extrusa TaxID=172846 RepID=A0AAV4SQU2_CAEEX|nr:hypothetical protein CEXT_44311 [Caerostris extrusa]